MSFKHSWMLAIVQARPMSSLHGKEIYSWVSLAFRWKVMLWCQKRIKRFVSKHGYLSKLEQFESLHCEKRELYVEYGQMSCQERNGQLCNFCEKDETTSTPLLTRRPYPDYGKQPNFHYLSWSVTPTNGHEADDFQPWAQIKQLFEESEPVSGNSKAIRNFSDKYIVPRKLVAEYVKHLAQKMRKEKKKEETEREWMERLNQEYSGIDWVGLYNSAMIKVHISSFLYDSMGCQQPLQPPLRNVQQQVTSSFSEVETDSQSDVVHRVVSSRPRGLSDESSSETDFFPEPRLET